MSEIQFHNRSREKMSVDHWRELQVLQRKALAATLVPGTLSSAEKAALIVGADDKDRRYSNSHNDPNTEVGRRFNANQAYFQPELTVGLDDDYRPVAFIYSAFNVSGGGLPEGPHNDSLKAKAIRKVKQLSVVKNTLWLREIVVDPDYQGEGFAHRLAKEHLAARDRASQPGHPVSAYVWPEEIPFIQDALERHAFGPVRDESGEVAVTQVQLYGPDNDPVEQVAMRAKTINAVLQTL